VFQPLKLNELVHSSIQFCVGLRGPIALLYPPLRAFHVDMPQCWLISYANDTDGTMLSFLAVFSFQFLSSHVLFMLGSKREEVEFLRGKEGRN
jgi:hypothetical protein